MKLQEIVRELNERLTEPKIVLDERDGCCLELKGGISVNIESGTEDSSVEIYSSIGDIPQQNKEILYQKLLEANLFSLGTGPARFGLDMKNDQIMLTQTLEMEHMDTDKFVSALENLIQITALWQDRLLHGDYVEVPLEDIPNPLQGGEGMFMPV